MAKKRKTAKKTALQRHKLALKIISENLGNPKTIKEELMKLGYTESYIDSGHLKDTRSWQTLLEEQLPDKDLLPIHKKLLNKKSIEYQTFSKSIPDKEIENTIETFGFVVMKISKYENWKRAYFSVIDTQAAKAALDMAYKLKKKYGDITITHKFGELSDEDLEGEIAGELSEALSSLTRKAPKKGKPKS